MIFLNYLISVKYGIMYSLFFLMHIATAKTKAGLQHMQTQTPTNQIKFIYHNLIKNTV